jgi:hypothetical protein
MTMSVQAGSAAKPGWLDFDEAKSIVCSTTTTRKPS